MKKIGFPILLLLLGILLGCGYAIYKINNAASDPSLILKNGVWRGFPDMDLAANDIQRAYIGKIGLLALRESEVMYYVASVDSDGNPLSHQYDYKLTGNNLNARYWSYTLYDGDHYLIPNEANVYSLNLDNITYTDSTRTAYEIFISPKSQKINWLPSTKGENMSILLRLYNPDESIYNHKTTTPLPQLEKIN